MGISWNKKTIENDLPSATIKLLNTKLNESENHEDVEDAVNLVQAMRETTESTYYELIISACDIPKQDIFNFPSTMIVVFMRENDSEDWKKIGYTDIIVFSKEPQYAKKIVVCFNQNPNQSMLFKMYQVLNPKDYPEESTQKYIGEVDVQLVTIILSQSKDLNLKNSEIHEKNGVLRVSCIESDIGQSKIKMTIELRDLVVQSKKVFFTISSLNAKNNYILIYKSTAVKNNYENCEFPGFTINTNHINSDSATMKFEFFEERKNGIPRLIGEMSSTLLMFQNLNSQDMSIWCNNFVIGKFRVLQFAKSTQQTFFSFVSSDFYISPIIGIDFSDAGSTKKLRQENDLEFMELLAKLKLTQSQNQKSVTNNDIYCDLKNTLEILNYFSNDYVVPVYSFGARLPPFFRTVSNCFSLKRDFFNPFMSNTEEIIDSMNQQIDEQLLRPYKPSMASEIIKLANEAARYLQMQKNFKQYYLLVIFTKCEFSDTNLVIEQLVEASELPLSVIVCLFNEKNDSTIEKSEKLKNEKLLKHQRLVDYFRSLDKELTNKLKNTKNNRNVFHFFNNRDKDQNINNFTRLFLRKLPSQYMAYMQSKQIVVNVSIGISDTCAKETIKSKMRKKSKNKSIRKQKCVFLEFLQNKEKEFFNLLAKKGFSFDCIQLLRDNKDSIPAFDMNIASEMIGNLKNENLRILNDKIEIVENMSQSKDSIQPGLTVLKTETEVLLEKFHEEYIKKYIHEQNTKREESKFIVNLRRQESQEIHFKEISMPKDYFDLFSEKILKLKPKKQVYFKKIMNWEKPDRIRRFFGTSEIKNPTIFEENNENLQNRNQNKCCVECKVKSIDIIFLNCAHALYCEKCYQETENPTVCDFCGDSIVSVFKLCFESMHPIKLHYQTSFPNDFTKNENMDKEKNLEDQESLNEIGLPDVSLKNNVGSDSNF